MGLTPEHGWHGRGGSDTEHRVILDRAERAAEAAAVFMVLSVWRRSTLTPEELPEDKAVRRRSKKGCEQEGMYSVYAWLPFRTKEALLSTGITELDGRRELIKRCRSS